VFMAGFFVVTALVGFIPDSISLLGAVKAGQRPPFPTILHVHAVLMGSWLLLLLAQTTLIATGNGAQHRKLGLVAAVLLPALVLAMPGVVHATWSWIGSIPAGAMEAEELGGLKVIVSNILLPQMRIAILFPALIIWALLVRRKDLETHKRLMILATLLPLPAAIDRITWLPASIPESPTSIHLYSLLLLLPVLVYDVVRRGQIHRAYVIGIALNLPFVAATHLLWSSPWWLAVAPKIVGIQGW
ncbi:MAG: hypothetical protein OEW59_02665, partial [Gammaproteobacteria bacterium]|nr:hypothetical protein [Gammaproteobacteria bacterium]